MFQKEFVKEMLPLIFMGVVMLLIDNSVLKMCLEFTINLSYKVVDF